MKKIFTIITMLLLAVGCNFFKSSKEEIKLIPFAQENSEFGYFDLDGKIVINPQFTFATLFYEDLALVKKTGENGKWGYINNEGKFVIDVIYTDATIFQDGLAWVIINNSAGRKHSAPKPRLRQAAKC